MKISNKTLGIVAMICAPGFLAQTIADTIPATANTQLGGVCDLLYMLGWMCSVIGLMRLHATGFNKTGIILLSVQFAFLFIACVWNIWVATDPQNNSMLFHILDMFWPLSNLCFLITGIVIAVKGILKGWKRYTALFAGLWLPIFFIWMNISGKNNIMIVAGCYSVIAWSVVGYMIYSNDKILYKESKPALYPLLNA